MRLIDADKLEIRCRGGIEEDGLIYIPYADVMKCIKNAPTVEAGKNIGIDKDRFAKALRNLNKNIVSLLDIVQPNGENDLKNELKSEIGKLLNKYDGLGVAAEEQLAILQGMEEFAKYCIDPRNYKPNG